MPGFAGLKVAWDGAKLSEFPDIRVIEIARDKRGTYRDEILTGGIGKVGAGGNSGFQALNLAVQFGARRILLVGFDMTDRGGVHWYGRNGWKGANNPHQTNFDRWLKAFDAAAPALRDMGAEVVNCSPVTAMKSFPRRSLADMLQEWQ